MALFSGQAAFLRILPTNSMLMKDFGSVLRVSRYSMMAPLRPATLLNAMRRNGCGFGEEPLVRLLPNVRPTNALTLVTEKLLARTMCSTVKRLDSREATYV